MIQLFFFLTIIVSSVYSAIDLRLNDDETFLYYFEDTDKNMIFTEVQGKCFGLRGDIVQVSSLEESNIFQPMVKKNAWIGVKETGVKTNDYNYIDGSSLTYSNWASSYPNNNHGNKNALCAYIHKDGYWLTDDCNLGTHVLCKIKVTDGTMKWLDRVVSKNRTVEAKLIFLKYHFKNSLNEKTNELISRINMKLTEKGNVFNETALNDRIIQLEQKENEQLNEIKTSISTLTQHIDELKRNPSMNGDIDIRIKNVENSVSFLKRNTTRIANRVYELRGFIRDQSKVIASINSHQLELKNDITEVNQSLTSAIEQLHPKDETM